MSNQVMSYDPEKAAIAATTTTEMAVSRQAQEVQAAMIVAKKFPRDMTAAWNRIMQSCKRPSLASRAVYQYPRGGETITGPSIRLAEALAQSWGNLDFGTIELEQRTGESTVMSYCWDLETNVRQTKIFTVPHIRQTRNGQKVLTDPRDIYEMVANQGARRLRACILGVIPKDVVDDALAVCYQTMTQGNRGNLADAIRQTVAAFQENLGIPQKCLEQYIGCKVEAFDGNAINNLRGVYQAIADGVARREDYFQLPKAEPEKQEQEAPNEPKQVSMNAI